MPPSGYRLPPWRAIPPAGQSYRVQETNRRRGLRSGPMISTTPLADLVALKIVELRGEGELESSLQYGNKPVTFSGLEPETEYLAVAAGVLSDGTVYGTPVSVRFTTERQLGGHRRESGLERIIHPGASSMTTIRLMTSSMWTTMLLPARSSSPCSLTRQQ